MEVAIWPRVVLQLLNSLQSNKMLLQTCFIPEDIKSDTMKAILWIEDIGKWSQTYYNGVE